VRVGSNGTSLLPDLATSWTVTQHGTAYTFHLRRGVLFQDGERLTASDVAFCLERARARQQLWSWTLTAVKRIRVVNSSTLRVELKSPWTPFLSDLALGDTGVYPQAYFRKHGAAYLAAHPVGTGPYRLESWRRGSSIRLAKNERSWRARGFSLRHIEFDLVANDAMRLLDVQKGDLDVDAAVPPDEIMLAQAQHALKIVTFPSSATIYLLLNNRVPPLTDVRVRQAMSHSIDRAALVTAVLAGKGQPANSFLPVGAIAYDAGLPLAAHDLSLARNLLRHSSVPHGFSLEMEVASGDMVQNTIASSLKEQLAALHIRLNIKQIDPNVLFKDLAAGNYHLTTSGWTNDIQDPDDLVSFAVTYTQGNRSFYTWYDNPTVGRLAHLAAVTSSARTRERLYYQIQQIWARDQPFLALYYQPFVVALSPQVHGFAESPLGYFQLGSVNK
jgi:peptide/nickel transport system substrate-binding protein